MSRYDGMINEATTWILAVNIRHCILSSLITYQSTSLIVMQHHETPQIVPAPDLEVQNVFRPLVPNVNVVSATAPFPVTLCRLGTCYRLKSTLKSRIHYANAPAQAQNVISF